MAAPGRVHFSGQEWKQGHLVGPKIPWGKGQHHPRLRTTDGGDSFIFLSFIYEISIDASKYLCARIIVGVSQDMAVNETD